MATGTGTILSPTATGIIGAISATAQLLVNLNVSNMRLKKYLSGDVELTSGSPTQYTYQFTHFIGVPFSKMNVTIGNGTVVTSQGTNPLLGSWDQDTGELQLTDNQRIPPSVEIIVMGNIE